jgi:hypothetical protein
MVTIKSEKCDQYRESRGADENLVPGASHYIHKCKSTEGSGRVLRAVLIFFVKYL